MSSMRAPGLRGPETSFAAAAPYLTPKTVEYLLTRVYRKLGLRSRAELARQFTREDALTGATHEDVV